MSKFKTFYSQFRVLFKKSFILSYRNWKGSLGQIIAPILVLLLLLFFQILGTILTSNVDLDPQAREIGKIHKCIPAIKNGNCKTLIYAPSGVKWVEDLLKIIANRNQLSFEEDFMRKKKKKKLQKKKKF